MTDYRMWENRNLWNNPIRLVCLACLFFILYACRANQVETAPPIQITNTPTHTSAPPTITPTPTLQPDLSRLTYECVEESDTSILDADLEGVLILFESKMNLETGKVVNFDGNRATLSVVVSPDRRSLSFTRPDSNLVQIADSLGVVKKEFTLKAEGLSSRYWVDSTHLVFTTVERFGAGPHPSFILDIETGGWIEISVDSDDLNFYRNSLGYYWFPFGFFTRTSINSGLKQLVYTAIHNELVLWDIEGNQVIARVDVSDRISFPRWSPDGTRFVTNSYTWTNGDEEKDLPYVGGSELISVSVTGEIERLTYLTTSYNVRQHSNTWSSDGTKVAFWLDFDNVEDVGHDRLEHNPAHPHQLAVLDITTGIVTSYCIKGLDSPVWSPDGKFLAVRASFLEDPDVMEIRDVYIIDLENNVAIKVTENGYNEVVGWMVSEP